MPYSYRPNLKARTSLLESSEFVFMSDGPVSIATNALKRAT